MTVKNILVFLFAKPFAVAQVVREEVVGVALCDCAVEVGEENEFGVGSHGGEGGG